MVDLILSRPKICHARGKVRDRNRPPKLQDRVGGSEGELNPTWRAHSSPQGWPNNQGHAPKMRLIMYNLTG
jgi:hypothetical protein